jgi:hypothetical protein
MLSGSHVIVPGTALQFVEGQRGCGSMHGTGHMYLVVQVFD